MNLVINSFNIFGLEVQFYGILLTLAFVCAVFVCLHFCKVKGYDKNIIFDLVIICAVCALVGARIYYVAFSGESWSFIRILQVWNGGLAIYGGIIGGAIGIIVYCKIKHLSVVQIFDMVAPALILGQCIGRIGCYFAGCCYGEIVTNPAMQWFPFAVEMADGWHYSTFFYESFLCLLGFIALFILYKKTNIKGLSTGCYFVYYGIVRCILEIFRGDSLYIPGTGIKVSWLLSILVIVLGIVWLTIFINKHKKTNSTPKNKSENKIDAVEIELKNFDYQDVPQTVNEVNEDKTGWQELYKTLEELEDNMEEEQIEKEQQIETNEIQKDDKVLEEDISAQVQTDSKNQNTDEESMPNVNDIMVGKKWRDKK